MPPENPTNDGNSTGKNDYEVGYKKPPKDTRFGGPRAPRRGTRPKSFNQLRKLAQEIAGEGISTEEKMTRIEAMLRLMSTSKNPADRKTFLEYAFGKPKDETEAEVTQKIVIEYVKQDNKVTPTPQSPDADQAGAQEAQRDL